MATVPSPTFGTLLRRYRLAAGLTQEELAERSGLSPRGIADLERGARKEPRKVTIQLLSEALHLSPEARAHLEAAARGRATPPAQAAPGGPMPRSDPTRALPLVGRAEALGSLARHLTEGPPLLLMTGEPGIGKSRLLQEGTLRAEAQGWTVLSGGCHRRSGQEPYAPFIGALTDVLRHQGAASRRLHLDGCAWLVRLLPELAERNALLLPTWSLPPEQERRLMFAAVTRYLTNIAGPAGTLLVLDDLHWAGPDALDLLQFLVSTSTARPLRVLGAYRDTEVPPDGPLALLVADLARHKQAARTLLAPLQSEEATALLATLLPDPSAEGASLRQQVLQRAGGLPFFLISCAEGLTTGTQSEPAGGHSAEVPWTVAETIRQRVMVLPLAAQRLLGVAAVMGRTASADVLLQVATRSGRGTEELLEALEACCRARLLAEAGGQAYRFPHDLVREAVLADLGTARRTLLHRWVAEALEQGPGSPPVEALAYHYAQSGEAEKAILYREQTGDAARSRYAYAEAADAYGQVVARLDTLGHTARAALVRERLGEVLSLLGHYDQALAVLEQAASQHRAGKELEGELRALAKIGQAHSKRGTTEEGLRRLQPVLEQLTTPEASLGAAACYVALAHLCFGSEQYQGALDAAERAATMARTLRDDATLLLAQERRAAACGILGQLEEAHQLLANEVLPLAEALGEASTLLRALNNLGAIYSTWGSYHEVQHCTERAMHLAERLGNAKDVSFLRYQVGLNAFCMGEWQRARALYEQVVREVRAGARFWGATYAFYGLGLLALAEGEPERASRSFEEAERLEDNPTLSAVQDREFALAERDLVAGEITSAYTRLAPFLTSSHQESVYLKEYLPLVAWVMLESGQDNAAQTMLSPLIAEAREARMRPVLLEALRAQARVWIRQQRWEEATRALEEALVLGQTLPNPYAEAKTLSVMGYLHLQQGAIDLARERLEAALVILGKLGERLYASHIEQMLAQLP
jgi:tetratricopeptide (TPR) repeat protein/transcriptional regulator with XRE-family HTH domain